MVSVKEVPANIFLDKLTEYLKNEVDVLTPPEWAYWVKTGVSRENIPDNPDWWYVRAASIMRKLYLKEPLGIDDLRLMYGGRRNRGVKPEHFYKSSGGIIRKILQQLEEAELVMKVPKGRMLTSKGRSLMDKIAYQIMRSNPVGMWYELYKR